VTSVIENPAASRGEPFITKVMPPQRPLGIVRRERLHRALSRAVDRHRLALLTAPAGYGKTSLLADFLDGVSAPVCWYSIDPEDNDARTFLRYLVAAIKRQFPEFGEGILHQLNSLSDAGSAVASLAGALVTEIHEQIPDWFVLVIEDLHWCDDRAVISAVDLLLRHLPDNCFIMLTSRTRVPVGAVSRLTVQRAVTRLDSHDLAFREDEVLELLSASGHAPDAVTAKRLAVESEGWAAGIILLAPWLDQPALRSPLEDGANQEELFWYLSDQVFQQLPPAWRDLLLRSAILPDVSVDLCVEAFGIREAGTLLKQMLEAGLFLTQLQDGGVYRYHALFRQFLLKRAELDGAPLEGWHCSAAGWYAGRGAFTEAVAHYLAGENPAAAADMLATAAPDLYQHGEWAVLAEMVASLQRQGFAVAPRLSLWRARCLVQLGEPDAALELAEQQARLQGTDGPLTDALLQIVRSAALRSKGRIDEAMAAARDVLRLLDNVPATPETVLLNGEGHQYLGVSEVMAGRHRDALPELEAALTLFEAVGSPDRVARTHSNLGISLYRLGRYADAIQHYERAIEGNRQLGNTGALASALNNLGNLYMSIGSFSLAHDVLNSALEAARLCGNTRVEAYATHSLGEVLAGAAHFDEAAAELRDAITLARQSGETVLEARALLSQARVSARLGSFRESEMLAKQAEDLVVSTATPYNSGLIDFSRGMSRLLEGRTSEAVDLLDSAQERFNQTGDTRWMERATLLLAQAAFQENDLDRVRCALSRLDPYAISEARPAALRDEAAIARAALKYAVEQVEGGERFARLRALADSAAAAPGDLHATVELQSFERPVVKALGLGDFSIEIDGSILDESKGLTAKAKELLFFLLSTGRRARRDELMEALWPGSLLKDSSVLRTNVYRLRKVLYDQCIVVQGDSYRIDPAGHFWFDLHYFKELVQRARQTQCSPSERVMLLETAIRLYRGPFLADVSADWCVAERYDLEIRFASAALSLATVYLKNGRHGDAASLCERVLAADPFDEEAVLLLVRAHLALGDRESAILHWRNFERRLQTEDGSKPSADAATRYEVLLRAS
jgi:LuxR family maltose regulon positive regulatory protein